LRIPPFQRRAGFTLIELLVVLAIIVVVAAIGWGSVYDQLPRYRMVRVAKALRSDVQMLRNLATSTNLETRLRFLEGPGDCADTSRWGGAWALEIGDRSQASTRWEKLPVDAEEDGSDDDQSDGLVDIGPDGADSSRHTCMRAPSGLHGPGAGNEGAVVFSPKGWVSNPGTDFDSSGRIQVTLINQVAASAGLRDEIAVRIVRTGATRLESSLNSSYSSNPVSPGASSSLGGS
jgi:prepilin-type N-terminal cleavage/methylation domain-containing protein